MKAVPGGEGGAALFQRRRGLAGTGLLPVPEAVDHVLHGLAWHVGISFGMGFPVRRAGLPGTDGDRPRGGQQARGPIRADAKVRNLMRP